MLGASKKAAATPPAVKKATKPAAQPESKAAAPASAAAVAPAKSRARGSGGRVKAPKLVPALLDEDASCARELLMALAEGGGPEEGVGAPLRLELQFLVAPSAADAARAFDAAWRPAAAADYTSAEMVEWVRHYLLALAEQEGRCFDQYQARFEEALQLSRQHGRGLIAACADLALRLRAFAAAPAGRAAADAARADVLRHPPYFAPAADGSYAAEGADDPYATEVVDGAYAAAATEAAEAAAAEAERRRSVGARPPSSVPSGPASARIAMLDAPAVDVRRNRAALEVEPPVSGRPLHSGRLLARYDTDAHTLHALEHPLPSPSYFARLDGGDIAALDAAGRAHARSERAGRAARPVSRSALVDDIGAAAEAEEKEKGEEDEDGGDGGLDLDGAAGDEDGSAADAWQLRPTREQLVVRNTPTSELAAQMGIGGKLACSYCGNDLKPKIAQSKKGDEGFTYTLICSNGTCASRQK